MSAREVLGEDLGLRGFGRATMGNVSSSATRQVRAALCRPAARSLPRALLAELLPSKAPGFQS
jgi:hypothetical protein